MSFRKRVRATAYAIQRARAGATADRRVTAAQIATPTSDAEIEAVWETARAAGAISPELEREHAEIVALRRYARALELRWAAALESILARSRLKEAHRAAARARRDAGLPLEPASRTRVPTWRHDLARRGGP